MSSLKKPGRPPGFWAAGLFLKSPAAHRASGRPGRPGFFKEDKPKALVLRFTKNFPLKKFPA